MSIYLFPLGSDLGDITEITKKAGVSFESFATVRELILKSQGHPISLGMIGPQELLVINRHATTLLDEMPSVVMSAPGVLYTPDWMSLASAFPAVDWKEIQGKLSKSGHLATTPEQLEKRNLGANTRPDDVPPVSKPMNRGLPGKQAVKFGEVVDPDDDYVPEA